MTIRLQKDHARHQRDATAPSDVLLRVDTFVTNHGADGEHGCAPHQAVLQAWLWRFVLPARRDRGFP